MANAHHDQKLHVGKFEASQGLKTAAYVCTAIGLVGFAIGLLKNPEHLWPAYLTAFFFVSLLGLGGLFWVAVNFVTNAGWSVSIRRLAEGMASFIPVMVIAGLVMAVMGLKVLFPWARPEEVAAEPVIQSKLGYLNPGFLMVRLLIFGLGTWMFSRCMVGNSVKQDISGDESLTHKNAGLSVKYLLFFSLAFTMFSMDLLMSLLPTWYSTIFGIYCFAGMFQSSLALLILIMLYMRKTGMVQGYYNDEHIHDVAKYLKGFTVFWAYIAFSQFMLIWYANIPEETEYYLMRAQNGWMGVSMMLLVGKFIVPFLVLLPRGNKRNPAVLIAICVWVLAMQYLDVYWMVGPNFHENQMTFGFYDVAMLLGFIGIFLLMAFRFYSAKGLVAVKDPRMHEALTHHVTY